MGQEVLQAAKAVVVRRRQGEQEEEGGRLGRLERGQEELARRLAQLADKLDTLIQGSS